MFPHYAERPLYSGCNLSRLAPWENSPRKNVSEMFSDGLFPLRATDKSLFFFTLFKFSEEKLKGGVLPQEKFLLITRDIYVNRGDNN